MKRETYNWRQIKRCIEDIYKVEAHPDDWGVTVIYKDSMLKYLKQRLGKIKQFIK